MGYLSENLAELAVGDIRRDARSKHVYDYQHWEDEKGRLHREIVFEPRDDTPIDSIAPAYRVIADG